MVRACQKPCFVTMGRRPRRGRLPIVPSGVPVVSRVRFGLPPSSASHAVGNGIPARRGDGRDGGGWGIRTPEGLHPTRFPSVRHRPLGESSRHPARTAVERRPRATDMEYIGHRASGPAALGGVSHAARGARDRPRTPGAAGGADPHGCSAPETPGALGSARPLRHRVHSWPAPRAASSSESPRTGR